MAKLGKVYLNVIEEVVNESVQVTEYAIEKGSPISDHIQRNSTKLAFDAQILGKDYLGRLGTLRDYMHNGTIINYVGRATASAVVITDVDRVHNSSIRNGVAVSIKVQKIRLSKSPWVKKKAQKPVTNGGKKKPTSKKPRPNPRVYHRVKKNDTYWDLARKYGTTVSKLRAFNKYPDRRIPIGVTLRIK